MDIRALVGTRRGTARLLLMFVVEAAVAGGPLVVDRGTLAELLGVTPAAVTKTLQRLASDGLELRVPHGIGADGRPVYAANGKTYRLQLPAEHASTASSTSSTVDIRHRPTVDIRPSLRVDTSAGSRVDTCPTCGHEIPAQVTVDNCPPSAMPPEQVPGGTGRTAAREAAADAGGRHPSPPLLLPPSPTARRLPGGGWRDWDPMANSGRGRSRYRCDTHAHLAANDPGKPCRACASVRAGPTRSRAAQPQRPLWPAAVDEDRRRRSDVTDPDELARRDAARAEAMAVAARRQRHADPDTPASAC